MMNTGSQAILAGLKKPKTAINLAVEDDMIMEVVELSENLTKEEAFSRVSELLSNVDFNYFQLGGALSAIQTNEWWRDEGFPNYRTCIEQRFGLHYRKAMYLVAIYVGLAESGVKWEQVSSLGWTKLKELAAILTPDNVDEWVEKAKTLTTIQLQEAVAQYKAGNLAALKAAGKDLSTKLTTITFKLHEDQKDTIKQAIDYARKEIGTEFDGVALEGVCLNYLAGGKAGKTKNLKAFLKGQDPREVVKTFNELWPTMMITIAID